jgi:light-regulated signal transduction histidine kinase (bacteriophytochrome)
VERRRVELTAEGLAAAGPRVIRIDDVQRDVPDLPLGVFQDLRRLTSYLAVPVLDRRGALMGGIALAHSGPRVFDDRDEQLVCGLASLTATATESALLFGQAHELIAALERSNRDLDHFAFAISHDLRAPLRGIANLSAWIEEDLEARLSETSREHLHLLRGRVHRLEDMVRGVYAYSRAGRDAGAPERIDCAALAHEIIELLAPPSVLRIELAPDLPVVHAPRAPLQQVLMNIVANAIKHNTSAAPRVELGARPCGDAWEFYVRDNGPGIAPRYHAQIWGLFQTLRSRDLADSTGIGLAIVRRIVETHGGRAWVESEEGAGATFRFTWPKQPRTSRVWR